MSSVVAKISDIFTLGGQSGDKLNILKVTPKMVTVWLKPG